MNSTREESRRRKELDSGGGISVLEEMLGEKNTSDIREKENIVQNDNYKSNVLNQFLPYANLLETINEDTISRKRKTKNRKKRHQVSVSYQHTKEEIYYVKWISNEEW